MARSQSAADAPPLLVARFPRRWALIGVVISAGFGAAMAFWIRSSERPSILAWVLLGVMVLGLLQAVLSAALPRRLLLVDADGLTLFRPRRPPLPLPWPNIVGLDYREHDDGQRLYKVIAVRTRGLKLEPRIAQLFRDSAEVAHIDAFASEPGGRRLFERLEEIRNTLESPPPLSSLSS